MSYHCTKTFILAKVFLKAILYIACILSLFACGDDDSSSAKVSSDDTGGEETTLGDVWAVRYPTNLAGKLADHTYLKAEDQSGNDYVWKCFGSRTDGTVLENTSTFENADIETIGFMASEAPCKWPLDYYLKIGVCFQCANRGLYYTGKTVAASSGYDIFLWFYGTFGDESKLEYQEYSFEKCLEAAPSWRGGEYLKNQTIQSKAVSAELDPEIALYQSYQRNIMDRGVQNENRFAFGEYLSDLVEMKIKQKLGVDFPDDVVQQTLAIQSQFYQQKQLVDEEMSIQAMTKEEMIVRYNKLFNDMSNQLKTILTPLEYETLLNLGYYDIIDVSGLLP